MTININFGRIIGALLFFGLAFGVGYWAYTSNNCVVRKLDDGTIHVKKQIFFGRYDYLIKDNVCTPSDANPSILLSAKLYDLGENTFGSTNFHWREEHSFEGGVAVTFFGISIFTIFGFATGFARNTT